MAERIRIHRESFENRKEQLQHWKFPQTVKREVLRFLDDLGLGKVNRGKKISGERQLQYLNALRVPLEFFNKSMAQLRLRDVENFEKALSSGGLCNKSTGRPYAHNTQVEMRKFLKIFLRWRLGIPKALALTGWFDTHYRPKTPDFLKEAEIERLYKHCRNARQRFLIAVLFDSGARAEEFHNIRFEDVQLPEGKENFVRITLKQEYSKTLGRTIALYWKYSLETIKEYLAERVAEGIKPADPVFRGDYTATRKFLQRLGQSVLNRPVHYHLFRHSSATYYATKLNRQELCYKFGWRFSSSMVDAYVARSGMETKALDEKFTQTELGTLKDDIAKLEQAARIKDEKIRRMEETMELLLTNLNTVSKVLNLNPTMTEVESALQRKQLPR
ncbi:MAG: site-specific integrase [Verrucomicrobia bacterium]|nr:site-specific integrase [Verrucomicrobiota bacterium]